MEIKIDQVWMDKHSASSWRVAYIGKEEVCLEDTDETRGLMVTWKDNLLMDFKLVAEHGPLAVGE